jgi:hypothetical protein
MNFLGLDALDGVPRDTYQRADTIEYVRVG